MISPLRYAIVSPVKDEERYVELTLHSVTAQSVPPVAWVIVDDGSTDRTAEIVAAYASRFPYIRLVRRPKDGPRRPGSPVIRAFNFGNAALDTIWNDIIVKLDCDLSFKPDYFEQLLDCFQRSPKLGIASGVYLEADRSNEWVAVSMPAYHAFGASKVIRRTCFEDIGGFVAAAGWDTVDEIRAISRGWETCHFEELEARHHKREGTGIGPLRTSRMHGEIFYVTGGDPVFFVLKAMRRLTTRPVLLNALALTTGYVGAVLGRQPRLVTPSEARCYRRLLRLRMWRRATRPDIALSSRG